MVRLRRTTSCERCGWWASSALSVVFLLTGVLLAAGVSGKPGNPHIESWRSGDIVFLDGRSLRSRIVRLVQSHSADYSHVGIVDIENGEAYVIHADPSAGRVVRQRWEVVLAPAQVSGGALYRVREGDERLTGSVCAAAKSYAREGVPFDGHFDLKTPNRLYCTELVLRAYRRSGLDLCRDAEVLHPYLLPVDLIGSGALEQVLRF